MAKLFNLAKMTTATTGTGTLTLGSNVSGFLSFAGAGISDGDVITYAIRDGANSEIGRGTYTASGTTLTRSVLKSTNSNTALNLSGSAIVSITAAAEDFVQGTTTNDSAAAGNIGEYQSVSVASGSAVSLTISTATDVASMSLTAGDWDVWGLIATTPLSGAQQTLVIGYTSTASATTPSSPNGGAYILDQDSKTAGAGWTMPVGLQRISIASTTTVYLGIFAQWSGGSGMQAYGFMAARRAR